MVQEEIKRTLIEDIRMQLLNIGHSIASWSRLNGYNSKDTLKLIHRYAEKPRLPQSPKIFATLKALERDTGINLMKKIS